MIKCACGCGILIPEKDKKNRPRRYVNGHNKSRLGIDSRDIAICKTCGKEFKYYKTKTSGVFCSKKCQYEFDYPGSYWVGKNGYLYYQKGRKEKVLVHRMKLDLKPGQVVHHKNGDKLDNRFENLEIIESQSVHIRRHLPDMIKARGVKQLKVSYEA